MKKMISWIFMISSIICSVSCNKAEFLDKKPSSGILQPTTIKDFQQLLENTEPVMNFTGGLSLVSSDEYTVGNADFSNLEARERNAYIWAKDIYGGDVAILDWNTLFQQIFYCNVVLEGLSKSPDLNTPEAKFTKGWALFNRAYAFYDLTRNFCKSYDATTANTDLGLPLRLGSGIDYLAQRSSLQKTFDQIFEDLELSIELLPATRPAELNRPSKIAAFALLARISMDIRNYQDAESNADKSLALYNKLIDYNSLSTTATTPFSKTNDELIYNTQTILDYQTQNSASQIAKISSDLISLYSTNDLRLLLYYRKLADGTYVKKNGYNGFGNYPFTGLATDEIYLIKAECLARKNEVSESMNILNQLLIKRWNPNATVPAKAYQNLTANSPTDALTKVLLERRKELVWRGLRWHDLKRLNKEGANIILTRIVNGTTYSLPPNDPRYVFPIPDDEITLSSIQQNIR